MVSIITPFYNAEDYLEEAICSVLEQTYKNWELLLINDASTDQSPQIAQEYAAKSSQIHCINLNVNSGAAISRNTGIQAARGDKIAFLDADDRWKPHKLEQQLKFMQTHNVTCCYSSYNLIDASGNDLYKKVCALPEIDFKKLEKANYIGNLSGVYDCSKLGKIYAATLFKRQDWTLWLDVVKKAGKAYGIAESLAYYRVSGNSISSNKWELIRYNYAVYKKHLGYSRLKSSYKMLLFFWEQLVIKRRQIMDDPAR